MIRSMSDKIFLNLKKDNKNIEYQNNNNINIKEITTNIINKERKSHQILKDGMKKIEKRLNSKDYKKGLYKTKSKDYLSLIRKMISKNFLK